MKRAHLSTTNWQYWIITANAVPFKATIKKSSRFLRGRTPSTSSTINTLLYPLHTTALVCLLWLDRGHNETYCKLDAQLISCLRTTVIRSIFLQVTFERILPDKILHHVSGHITPYISSTVQCIWAVDSQWKHLYTNYWVHPTKSPSKQFPESSFKDFLYLAIWQEVDTQPLSRSHFQT